MMWETPRADDDARRPPRRPLGRMTGGGSYGSVLAFVAALVWILLADG